MTLHCSRPALQGCRYPRQGRDGGEKSRIGSSQDIFLPSSIHSWSGAKTRIQHAVMLGLSEIQPPWDQSQSLSLPVTSTIRFPYKAKLVISPKQCLCNSIKCAPLITHSALDSIFKFICTPQLNDSLLQTAFPIPMSL